MQSQQIFFFNFWFFSLVFFFFYFSIFIFLLFFNFFIFFYFSIFFQILYMYNIYITDFEKRKTTQIRRKKETYSTQRRENYWTGRVWEKLLKFLSVALMHAKLSAISLCLMSQWPGTKQNLIFFPFPAMRGKQSAIFKRTERVSPLKNRCRLFGWWNDVFLRRFSAFRQSEKMQWYLWGEDSAKERPNKIPCSSVSWGVLTLTNFLALTL